MGHNICHRVYKEKVNKRNVQNEWDEIVNEVRIISAEVFERAFAEKQLLIADK